MNFSSTTTMPFFNQSTVVPTIPTNSSNSTTAAHVEVDTLKELIIDVVNVLIFCASVFGNILLISSIVIFKHLRRIESNYLILNLAVCDVIKTVFSIPFMMVAKPGVSYPFGLIGCKLITPLATYGSNASVFTLVCIALERFFAIRSGIIILNTRRIIAMIFLIHVTAAATITPYVHHLIHELWEGNYHCYEEWPSLFSQKAYTISLFLVQYGIPLSMMTVLYTSIWLKIRQKNKKMIELSEEYERKMEWETKGGYKAADTLSRNTTVSYDGDSNQSTVSIATEEKEQNNNTNGQVKIAKTRSIPLTSKRGSYSEDNANQPTIPYQKRTFTRTSFKGTFKRSDTLRSIRRGFQQFRKPHYASHIACVRHKQTVRTLKMFTSVVIVFLIFAMPNQIVWLLRDFSHEPSNNLVIACDMLTYMNSVVNCWIYGGFNKNFWKAYKRILSYIFTCGQSAKQSSEISRSAQSTKTSFVKGDSYHDNRQQEQIERQNAFTDMFQQHYNNFDQFKHLYNFQEEENENLIQKSGRPKRRRTLANLLNALNPTSRRSSSLSLPQDTGTPPEKRKYSLLPPILPFTQASGNIPLRKARSASCNSPSNRNVRRNSSMELLPTINTPVSPSQQHDRKRRSSTPARYQHDMITPFETSRKTSVWAMLTPRILRKKVIKRSVENEVEIPTITVMGEDNIFTESEEVQIKEVQTVDIKTETVYKVKKRKASDGVAIKTSLSPRSLRKTTIEKSVTEYKTKRINSKAFLTTCDVTHASLFPACAMDIIIEELPEPQICRDIIKPDRKQIRRAETLKVEKKVDEESRISLNGSPLESRKTRLLKTASNKHTTKTVRSNSFKNLDTEKLVTKRKVLFSTSESFDIAKHEHQRSFNEAQENSGRHRKNAAFNQPDYTILIQSPQKPSNNISNYDKTENARKFSRVTNLTAHVNEKMKASQTQEY